MDLMNFYYDFNVGEFPENNEFVEKTNKLFDYLLDAGLSDIDITSLIVKEFGSKDYLTIEDIPDSVWDNSLLKRNTFYYHRELEILSKPPTWDTMYPFYKEMKIVYTERDVIDYLSSSFNINKEWINYEQEIGSVKYLINKYKMFRFIEPIDFILLLIDYVKSKSVKVYKLYDICNLEMEFAELLELDIKNAVIQNKNVIVWR